MVKKRKPESIGEIRRKITKTYELISTSYHEAGHTVYALMNFMKVKSVSVFEARKEKRIHGVTNHYHPCDFKDIKDVSVLRTLVGADVGIGFAGLIAEEIFFQSITGSDKLPTNIKEGSDKDYDDAEKLIDKHNIIPAGKMRTVYKKKLSENVRRDLIDNWDAITIVAHALFRHRKLSFRKLKSLLTTKSRNKKRWKKQLKAVGDYYGHK
jgi:hypothetical protein